MFHKIFDLLIVALLVLAAVAIRQLIPENAILSVVMGVPFMLVLPGYALTVALFSGRELGFTVRLLLILGISLIVGIVMGLILHWTPGGLHPAAWLTALTLVTMIGVVIGGFRRVRSEKKVVQPIQLGFSFGQTVLMWLAALITLGAIIIAVNSDASQQYPGFTQLWLVPNDQGTAAEIGVASSEHIPMHYRLIVEADGELILEKSDLSLQPNERWETAVVLPDEYTLVNASLYLSENPDAVYRQVALKR